MYVVAVLTGHLHKSSVLQWAVLDSLVFSPQLPLYLHVSKTRTPEKQPQESKQ